MARPITRKEYEAYKEYEDYATNPRILTAVIEKENQTATAEIMKLNRKSQLDEEYRYVLEKKLLEKERDLEKAKAELKYKDEKLADAEQRLALEQKVRGTYNPPSNNKKLSDVKETPKKVVLRHYDCLVSEEEGRSTKTWRQNLTEESIFAYRGKATVRVTDCDHPMKFRKTTFDKFDCALCLRPSITDDSYKSQNSMVEEAVEEKHELEVINRLSDAYRMRDPIDI